VETSDLTRKLDAYIADHLDEWIAELAVLCAEPSVPAHGSDMEACARLVAEMLRKRGLAAEILPTSGQPVVYGEAHGRSPRTLLFYNHYDVQPPEPLDLWDSPPFELTRRGGELFARGVSDDKGHLVCRLAALDAVLAVTGSLPIGVKFLIEGEEESGSASLAPFIAAHRDRLAADACVWEFGEVDAGEVPLLHAGMRGICFIELRARTASLDAHSGIGGSIFPNAAWRLVWALHSLKGPDERIRIPGFYEDARPATARDMELLSAIPDPSADYLERYGLAGFLLGMTGGVELQRAEVFEPTCTICGLSSGYEGPGAKTVLPAAATAKVDFRLVPDQKPADILAKLRAHLTQEGFADIEIAELGSEPPGRVDPDHPFLRLVAETARGIYEHEMLIVPMIGGSGPNHAFIEQLGVPIATPGISHPGARVHAPNENIRLDLLEKGIRHTTRIMLRFSEEL
jgi:acetylornithine deacetylase/succinyl-diaminopimelate desuccinylase-like protein